MNGKKIYIDGDFNNSYESRVRRKLTKSQRKIAIEKLRLKSAARRQDKDEN